MVPSAATIKEFYHSYFTLTAPFWNDQRNPLAHGSRGRDVVSLSIILEGFGFAPLVVTSDTGTITIDDSYSAAAYQAVVELQKAFKLPVTGVFGGDVQSDFEAFYYNISSILIAPAQDTTKLAIVYPGGVTSFFNGSKFDKASSAVTSFTVSAPTFIMQNSAGKNFVWNNDKWNATTTAFPTPRAVVLPTPRKRPIDSH